MSGTCLLRANASGDIGTGHVTRLISLGTWWRRAGGEALFTGSAPAALRQRASDRGIKWISDSDGSDHSAAAVLAESAKDSHADWICIDGYQFRPGFVEALKSHGARILQFADGIMWPTYKADILVDQNLGAERRKYPILNTGRKTLQGSAYACLDTSFLTSLAENRDAKERAENVLVTMGGADPLGATLLAVDALKTVGDFKHAVVVVGASNSRIPEIEAACAQDHRFSIIRNATNMPELMAQADIAIAAAGTTSWELAAMGVPMLLVVTADNQVPIAAAVEEAGVGLSAGDVRGTNYGGMTGPFRRLLGDVALRSKLSEAARSFIDGYGGERIVQAMLDFRGQ